MRVPSIYRRTHHQPEVMMTPMIDVVFLLLIFFLWTASFEVVEHLLPSNILSAGGTNAESEVDPELIDLERIVVRILWQDGQPAWTLNGAAVSSLAEIHQRLNAVASIQSDLPVLLDPVAEVPLGHVIDVYDRTRQVGFGKIQFAAEATAAD